MGTGGSSGLWDSGETGAPGGGSSKPLGECVGRRWRDTAEALGESAGEGGSASVGCGTATAPLLPVTTPPATRIRRGWLTFPDVCAVESARSVANVREMRTVNSSPALRHCGGTMMRIAAPWFITSTRIKSPGRTPGGTAHTIASSSAALFGRMCSGMAFGSTPFAIARTTMLGGASQIVRRIRTKCNGNLNQITFAIVRRARKDGRCCRPRARTSPIRFPRRSIMLFRRILGFRCPPSPSRPGLGGPCAARVEEPPPLLPVLLVLLLPHGAAAAERAAAAAVRFPSSTSTATSTLACSAAAIASTGATLTAAYASAARAPSLAAATTALDAAMSTVAAPSSALQRAMLAAPRSPYSVCSCTQR